MLGNFINVWFVKFENDYKVITRKYKTENGARKAFNNYNGNATIYRDTNVVNQAIRIDYK